MKPVCDHPSSCKSDSAAIYLGQDKHLAFPPHRNNAGYVPAGFAAIKDRFAGLCLYSGSANGNHAMCNMPAESL